MLTLSLLFFQVKSFGVKSEEKRKEEKRGREEEMGIQGLLPQLKSIMVPIHIKDLKGCSVAVDTYSWLHKGALSCSTQLCKGIPTSRSGSPAHKQMGVLVLALFISAPEIH